MAAWGRKSVSGAKGRVNGKGQKYANKKIEYKGHLFDSKLELFCFQKMEYMGIEFDFQVPILLIPKFKNFENRTVRSTKIVLDFVIHTDDCTYYVDAKGQETPEFRIKWKLLERKIMRSKTRTKDYKMILLKGDVSHPRSLNSILVKLKSIKNHQSGSK